MTADHIEPDLPLNPLPYLTDWLFEIGPTGSGGMGPTVIGWQDIMAWQGLAGVELEPWEARVLRRLSSDFLNTAHEAKDNSMPAPYLSSEAVERNREAVSKQVAMGFAAFKQTDNKGGKDESGPT